MNSDGNEAYPYIKREDCTHFEWQQMHEDGEYAALWLCAHCDEFWGVETDGTTDDLCRSRCLKCGAHSTLKATSIAWDAPGPVCVQGPTTDSP
jgi:hypothetical protein